MSGKSETSQESVVVVPGVGEMSVDDVIKELSAQPSTAVTSNDEKVQMCKEILAGIWAKDAEDKIAGLTSGEAEAVRRKIKEAHGKNVMPSFQYFEKQGWLIKAKPKGRLARYVITKAGFELGGIEA